MFSEKRTDLPQLVDRMLHRLALTVFLMAVAYCAAAGVYFAPEGVVKLLGSARTIIGLVAVAISLPTAISLILRYMKGEDRKWDEPGGFLHDVLAKAGMYSFTVTFIFMVFFDLALNGPFRNLPALTVLHIVLAVSLFSVSTSFYLLSRDSGDDVDEGGN